MTQPADQAADRAGGRHGTPWRAAGTGLVALLALGGAGLIGAALNAPDSASPPQPHVVTVSGYPEDPATATPPAGSDLPEARTPPLGSDPTPTSGPAGRPLERSEPLKITIPRIGVGATIMPLGVTGDGMVQVPPLAKAQLAGWYQLGPTPGEPGNAVIVGHVDSKEIGPAVFFRLGALLPGDTIEVIRRDGKVATFVVEGVRSYPKTAFPTDLVYGPTDVPGLRLVTCGGDFDERSGSYPDNIIAFARLGT